MTSMLANSLLNSSLNSVGKSVPSSNDPSSKDVASSCSNNLLIASPNIVVVVTTILLIDRSVWQSTQYWCIIIVVMRGVVEIHVQKSQKFALGILGPNSALERQIMY